MALEQEPPKPATYIRYADFLDGDSRRRGNALELGHDWRDGDDCYRVCWYEETGELTCERLAAGDMPDLEDFHEGIAGPIEVLAVLSTREAPRGPDRALAERGSKPAPHGPLVAGARPHARSCGNRVRPPPADLSSPGRPTSLLSSALTGTACSSTAV